jgi:hypothetical protein
MRKEWNEKALPKRVAPKGWRKPENSRLIASVMFPNLATEQAQQEMVSRTERGKRAPAQQRLLKDHERGAVSPLGNVAQPDPRFAKKGKK